jgi:hypothetical protein
MGTGMNDAEASVVSERLNLATVRAYRLAVGARTREVVGTLPAEGIEGLGTRTKPRDSAEEVSHFAHSAFARGKSGAIAVL